MRDWIATYVMISHATEAYFPLDLGNKQFKKIVIILDLCHDTLHSWICTSTCSIRYLPFKCMYILVSKTEVVSQINNNFGTIPFNTTR